jgi:alkylation response protein AidB-like acyl-CoA dehydrogenase
MVDFRLSEEQISLQNLAKDFARKEIEPICASYDRKQDPKDCFPAHAFAKAIQFGLQSIYIPREYGGMGLGDFEASLVFEEIGAADAGFASALCISASIAQAIIHFGTKEQKGRWLPKICKDTDFILGFGVTEYGVGSEAYIASEDPKVGSKTTCKLEGDHYVINGVKHFISNGGCGKLYGVAARNSLEKPMFGTICTFFVDADTPGFRIGKIEDKMGQRLMLNGELIFENVKVPKENLVGQDGGGAAVLLDIGCSTSVTIGAIGIGIARTAYELAASYARKRMSGGKPLIEHEAVSLMLADMKMEIDAARSLLWRNTWLNDRDGRDYPRAAEVKVYCAEVSKRVANWAMQIYGGLGYMRDSPVEKLVRDSAIMTIYDGTSEVLKQWISGQSHL